MAISTFSHVGLCDADLDRSLAFYCEGLGFVQSERHELGSELAAGLEVVGAVAGQSQFIRKGETALALLWFRSPPPDGVPSHRRNQLGITHLGFVVSDIDATLERLTRLGGRIVDGSRNSEHGRDVVMVCDPDGVRVTLLEPVRDDRAQVR